MFPAPHRAGLIEASSPIHHSELPATEFPAPHRAGLIEACSALSGWPASRRFPAPHRAGLIEAIKSHRAQRTRRALFPAPHRAGLIEASRARPNGKKREGSFRLLTEPASLKPFNTSSWSIFILTVSGSSQSRPH